MENKKVRILIDHTMSDKKTFILQKDIVIPAGTKFDNYSNEAIKYGYVEAVVGFGKDCVEFFRINDINEIMQHEPTFFIEGVGPVEVLT